MDILRLLFQNWDSVLLIIAAVLGGIFIFKRSETRILKDILFRLITKAEADFGGGTGELKRAAVIDGLYERMPWIFRLIFTRKDIDRLIDEVLVYARACLHQTHPLNNKTE